MCVLLGQSAHLLPKSTGNTQEAVAPSQHDGKSVYRDVRINQPTNHARSIMMVKVAIATVASLKWRIESSNDRTSKSNENAVQALNDPLFSSARKFPIAGIV